MCFDDEDGVTFLTPVAACQTAQVTVIASAAGKLDAWIDFNRDGDFNDAGEQIFTSRALVAGANTAHLHRPLHRGGGHHLRPLPPLLGRRPRTHRRRSRRRGRGLRPQRRRRRLRRRAGQLRHACSPATAPTTGWSPASPSAPPRTARPTASPPWAPRATAPTRTASPSRPAADRLLDGQRAGDPHQHRRHRHPEARRLDRLRRRRRLQRSPRPRRHRPRAGLRRQHADRQRPLRRQVEASPTPASGSARRGSPAPAARPPTARWRTTR